jgi:hypothetical protein
MSFDMAIIEYYWEMSRNLHTFSATCMCMLMNKLLNDIQAAVKAALYISTIIPRQKRLLTFMNVLHGKLRMKSEVKEIREDIAVRSRESTSIMVH